ncbi:class I SAM-dependent methyltransferase [Henriciella sp. AS95]|uniref:class I SAM-dependent methyltransferase n=1 Tax=Henriciella sp. AS95 TaxID=3135782 RepID=UPI00317B5678
MKDVYERQAGFWQRQRRRDLYEQNWLDKFLDGLPVGGRLLDLGCGMGEPIGAYFLRAGYDLVGTDYSEAMISLARVNQPRGNWQVRDMRQSFADGNFDGICSWDAFFHLSIDDQRNLLPRLCSRVKAGGAILLTVGPSEGEVGGHVGGEPVFHASLSPEEYREILGAGGFANIEFVPEDPSTAGRSVLLGRSRRVG